LVRAGHTVFASMRNPQAQNREHAQALRAKDIEVVELDVSSDTSVERAVQEVLIGLAHARSLVGWGQL
jgi:NAD(P)-dependent dehydrogenase (short-subunit alcohol dehydrogenase family)